MTKKEKRTLGCIAVVIALLFIFCARFAVMAKMPTNNTTRGDWRRADDESSDDAEPLPKGDPDADGEITVADALITLRVAARLTPETPELIAACDVDGDEEITVADALVMLRVAAGLIDARQILQKNELDPFSGKRIPSFLQNSPKKFLTSGEADDILHIVEMSASSVK